MPDADAAHRAALAWREALAAGGTTPWRDFLVAYDDHGRRAPDRPLPGAQQLELARRANLAGAPAGLRARILGAGLTGRGLPDLPLSHLPATGVTGRPTDPSTLDPEELSRVALGVLTDQLRDVGPAAAPAKRSRSRGPAYTLGGDPWLCDGVRRQLRAAGREPGGWRAPVFVLGDRLDRMLAHAWVDRCIEHGPPEWAEWLGGLAQDDRLPPRTDLVAVAARRSREAKVELAFDTHALGQRLRVDLETPRALTLEAAELLRRISVLLGLLDPQRRSRLLRNRLVPELGDAGSPIVSGAGHHEWLASRAARLHEGLVGYPCHGDADRLIEAPESGRDTADEAVLLELAIVAMTRLEPDRPATAPKED